MSYTQDNMNQGRDYCKFKTCDYPKIIQTKSPEGKIDVKIWNANTKNEQNPRAKHFNSWSNNRWERDVFWNFESNKESNQA